MLSKEEKVKYRSQLFRHLDGIVTTPIAFTFHKKGITTKLLSRETVNIESLAEEVEANEGYFNVALRALASQGWLAHRVDNQSNEVTYHINEHSAEAFSYFGLYEQAINLMRLAKELPRTGIDQAFFMRLVALFKLYQSERVGTNSLIKQQVLMHLEGVILGPILVHLGMSGMFHKYFMETRFRAEEFHKDATRFEQFLDILVDFNWFEKRKGAYAFTEKGLFFARRASAYGVTVSYLPMLTQLDELLFGNPLILKSQQGARELHVNREMNVWGSGGAHSAYFKVIDKMIIDIFNRPIEEQPRGILDMGCGNGAFLIHLFSVIEQQTLRGKHLEDYPLMIIGVDYNEAALKVSKANLIQADIWAKIIWGDIGDPEGLAKDLMEQYDLPLEDLLNVRTFLDHNRPWNVPTKSQCNSQSSGAFAFEGRRISNNEVRASLKEHFEKWSSYVQRFGLILIELHTISSQLVADNLGRTAATAYDVTHGLSDQYILELSEFMEVLGEVGLEAAGELSTKFPNSDLVTVSINWFKS